MELIFQVNRYLQYRSEGHILEELHPVLTISVRQGRDYIWLENHQRRQEWLHLKEALKNETNLDSQLGKREEFLLIEGSLWAIAQRGRAQISYSGHKGLGRGKAGKEGPVFKKEGIDEGSNCFPLEDNQLLCKIVGNGEM